MSALLFLIFSMTLAGNPSDTSPDTKPVGVLLASPGWQMGQLTVSTGEKLPATATLTLKTGESSELILQCPNHGWLSYSCNRYPCHVPVCSMQPEEATVRRVDKGAQTGEPPQPSFAQSFLALLTHDSRPPVTTGVRGGGNPNDAVILQRGEEIHLAPALMRVLEGDYCFGLRSLDAPGDRASLVFRLAWDKSEEPEGIIKLPNLRSGTYALEKEVLESSGTCSADPQAVPAWIVIAPQSDFESLNTRWKSDEAWFNQVAHSGASAAVQTTVRHAAIADLSESISH